MSVIEIKLSETVGKDFKICFPKVINGTLEANKCIQRITTTLFSNETHKLFSMRILRHKI